MSSHACAAVTTPDTLWVFCPNFGAAYAFCIFFGLTFLSHVLQGVYHRKAYAWVIAMSALWQTIAYAFRIVSISTPASLGNYAAWFVLILVAPLWTNAFVYVSLCRLLEEILTDRGALDGHGSNDLELYLASESFWHHGLEMWDGVCDFGYDVCILCPLLTVAVLRQ